MKIPFLAGVLLLGGLAASSAADVTLKANDAAGTSSFTGSGNWSSGAAPAPGNMYFTTNASGVGQQMRTPTGLASNVFAGDALVLYPNPTYGSVSLLIKGNQGSYAVVNNLIMDGGSVGNGGTSSGANTTNTLAGFINVVSSARFDSGGSGRAILVAASITNGVGPITCTNAGSIWMFGANSGFTGKMAAIGNCTLRITNQFNLGANPASFTADQLLLDNGTFSVTNSVSLDDPNRGITLSTNGGKFDVAADATLTLPNPITGRGSLTKTGAGTLILNGANSYTNGTVVSSGILKVQNSLALGTNGTVNQASGGRNSTIQLEGDITLPAAVNFTLSNDGTGTTSLATTNAIENISGNNTINGTITLTVGGGSAVIQSDSGALWLAGNLRIASGQSSRGVFLQGDSTAANTISGSITDLSASSVNSVTKTGTGSWTLSGTNTYTGPTTINGGTLALSDNGSISNTPLITIASGATFDVSGLVSPFTLGAGQTISNSTGTVKGSVTTAGGGSICPGTTWEAGTLTFNDHLNLSAGGTVTFDLSPSAAGGNDRIAVGGNLALSNSDYVHINAVSGYLDTADYVLFSVGMTTTMSTTPVLVWDGFLPGNYLNYSLLKVGNNVVLHYSSATAPSVTASVNPTFVTRFQTVIVTANVTKGSGNLAGVTVDLTQIGGSASAGLVLDSAASTPPTYIYTNTFWVAASATLGDKSLAVTATDTSSPAPLTGTYIISPLTIAANTVTWSGGASDNQWTSNPNWTSDIGPGVIGDSVTFSGLTRLTPDMNANYSVTGLTFDGTAGAFTLGSSTGSTLTNSGGIVNNSSSAQTLNVPVVLSAAQTLNAAVGNLTVNSNVSLGGNSLTVDGAATTAIGGVISGTAGLIKNGSGTLVLPNANTYGNNGAADTALNAGTLVIGHDLALGTSRLNIGDGGAIQSADSSTRIITNRLNFGSGAGGNAIFSGTGNLIFTASAANGTAKTLTVNNPKTEFSGVLGGASARTVAGSGTLLLSGANTYSGGTTINPGATLQLGNGDTNGSLSTSGAIVDDGTLKFNRSDALVQGIHFSSVPITGAGSIVQAGSGTTTLNASNNYTGLTTVNNGGLLITPAYQGRGDVFVGNEARFGVSASSVANSAIIGNLTLGTGGTTTLDLSYGLAGNPTNPALVAGAVTINGASTIRISGSFVLGTFPVLKYDSLSGAFAGTVAGPRGVTATLVNDAANHVIYVTVSSIGSGIVWTGTNSFSPNLWDLNTTTNWLFGGQETAYLESVPPGDAVIFNDLGSGVVLLSNTVSPAKITLSNAVVNYTFQGSGQINASAGLTKVGPATVTMNVPGVFSGSTVLSNGTVSLGANQTFANLTGDSAVSVSTGTPTLTVNNSLNSTFAGNVSGPLTLTKTEANVLTMTGSNSFTGNLFVKAGGLTLDSGFMGVNSFCSIGQNGTDNGTLTLKGTANFSGNNDFNVGDVGASVGTLNIQDTASLTVNSFFIGSANGAGTTASGTVNQTGGTVTQVSSATGAFAVGGRSDTTSIGGIGVYNMDGGVLNAASAIRVGAGGVGAFNQNGGTVNAGVDVNIARFAGSTGTYNLNGGTLRTARVTSSTGANATLNLNGGVLLAREDNTSIITNIPTVNVRDGGAVVDTTNFNVSISSALAHSFIGGDNAIDGGLTKRGSGTLTLAEAYSSYTGPTVVTGGALNLSPGSIYTLNQLTLSNGALGLTLNGGTASYSAADLKLAGNSALNLNYDLISGAPVAAINASGSLTASGKTTINVFGYGWTVGQFTLVDYAGTPLANLNNFALGALPYGATASLSNNVANTSIDLVVTAVSVATWIPLAATDTVGMSSFNTAGYWQDGNPPIAGNGYFTKSFALRSPADTNAYTFAGTALSVDRGGRFIMKGTNGQTMTINNLILNGGIVDYANSGDNFTETLAGNITLQGGLTSFLGALGSAGASETLFVTAPIGGDGDLQLGGANVNGGQDNGLVVLAGTNTYTGTTTVAGGTLLVNGSNGNSVITVNANATLGGLGSIAGLVTVQSGGTLAPGTPSRGALSAALGTLTVGGTATVEGTVLMKIDRAATPASDRLNAPTVVVNPGATLVVNNLGSTSFVAGDTFALFSTPVQGAFTTVDLPPLPNPDLYWTNKLAVDGTLAVAAAVMVDTSRTNITATVSGNTLTLSWPAGHLGWYLQVQTNSLSDGLGTNWVTIPGSEAVTSTNLTINPANGSVFYRMVYP